MLALTLRQPRASLLLIGAVAFVERKWFPEPEYVGQRIAIHAGRYEVDEWVGQATAEQADRAMLAIRNSPPPAGWPGPFPTSAILGTALLSGAYRIADRRRANGRIPLGDSVRGSGRLYEAVADGFEEFEAGAWLLHFTDVKTLPQPIAAKGGPKIWEWTPPQVQYPAAQAQA